jgi:hypothetical protein
MNPQTESVDELISKETEKMKAYYESEIARLNNEVYLAHKLLETQVDLNKGKVASLEKTVMLRDSEARIINQINRNLEEDIGEIVSWWKSKPSALTEDGITKYEQMINKDNSSDDGEEEDEPTEKEEDGPIV